MSIPQWVSAVFAALLAVGPLGPMAAVAQTSTSATAPLQPMQSMQPETIDESVATPARDRRQDRRRRSEHRLSARQGDHL